MRCEQQAVVHIQAFVVIVAGGPGFDVAGSQEISIVDLGNGATTIPCPNQVFTKNVLPNALDCGSFNLSASEHILGDRNKFSVRI